MHSGASRCSTRRKVWTGSARGRIDAAVSLRPFHLAFPVDDLEAARRFYGGILGCPEGRSAEHWVDFDLHGHQIVAHLVHPSPSGEGSGVGAVPGAQHSRVSPTPTPPLKERGYSNQVDGEHVPVPHFGLVLSMDEWKALAGRLTAAGVEFVIAPTIRFEGEPGEQATMFLLDPAGNALEFKAMADPSKLFATD
jgi:extradiol dioxygenase family protein